MWNGPSIFGVFSLDNQGSVRRWAENRCDGRCNDQGGGVLEKVHGISTMQTSGGIPINVDCVIIEKELSEVALFNGGRG